MMIGDERDRSAIHVEGAAPKFEPIVKAHLIATPHADQPLIAVRIVARK